MKARLLYPFLFLWVLLLAGCGAENPEESATPADASADAAADTTAAAPANPGDEADAASARTRVLVLGNSLAAGYGLDDPAHAFPGLMQATIDSLGWDVEVVNAGLSGETTAGGLRRIDWLLRQRVDVLILELGGNDGLRGIPPAVTEQNLRAIIEKTRDRYPEARVILAGMQIPPNLGQDYARQFRDVYPRVAGEADAALIPFLLEGVGGVAALMQNDGIHPTAEGQRLVARNVWEVLEPVLRDLRAPA